MGRSIWILICAGLILSRLAETAMAADPHRKERERVESLYYNGQFYTMKAAGHVVEAVAISGDRIIAAGSSEELAGLCNAATKRYDLKGLCVIPGLVDAHAHFNGYALGRESIDLTGTSSLVEISAMVSDRARRLEKGEWIKGRGWDQNDWSDQHFPGKKEIDEISPGNPVFLVRVCGHAAIVNSPALVLAGIDRNTPDPPGGKIIHGSDGEPTGLLIDEALELVRVKIPSPGRDEKKRLYREAALECLSVGLTGVHEMGISAETASIYREMYIAEELPVRLTVYYQNNEVSLDSLLDEGPMRGFAGHHFEVAGVKFYSDGSLGARSAALIDDYSDDPGNRGLLVTDPGELYRGIVNCHSKGFPVAVHAIGDRGNRMVLDQFEKVRNADGLEDMRDRIEHAQVLSPDDIGRFARLGVVPSMQFTHCTSDMGWARDRLGPERIKGAYAWRTLISAGCRIPGGSDFPVESIDPMLGIYAAVTRMDLEHKPEGGWRGCECLNIEEAVRAFTLDAAWAVHQEEDRGSIEKGKLADFVVLSEDIMKIEPELIPRIEVVATVIGGEIVYRSDRPGL
ncbi:MAG: amidohydrolase [Candidatus Krumholzibacteriota bacterium]|nr:amidohydrolase [Candidatus Krumholzibacteriota bacterium]